ncbi:MAG: GDSL-type esterase/lipase family protein [Bacteroidota bacterium]
MLKTNICLFVLLILVLFSFSTQAQEVSRSDERDYNEYDFLLTELNKIRDNKGNIKPFFDKLSALEKGETDAINIVHIGDSHIQADYLTGRLRSLFGEQFGFRGRGLVFPYQLAKTNSPTDLWSESNISWSRKRIIQPRNTLPEGISGLSVHSTNPAFWLKMQVKSEDYFFDKVTIFSGKGADYMDFVLFPTAGPRSTTMPVANKPKNTRQYHVIQSGETLSSIASTYRVSLASIRKLNNIWDDKIFSGKRILIKEGENQTRSGSDSKSDQGEFHSIPNSYDPYGHFAHTVWLNQPVNAFYLKGVSNSQTEKRADIFGFMLENTQQAGINYHMIGVNGATFGDYGRSNIFWDQLAELKPDLVIFSMGTNETLEDRFTKTGFQNDLESAVKKLRESNPKCPILLTTPADALKKRKINNPNILQARNVVLASASKLGFSTWDLYYIMGGAGSIKTWYQEGLAQGDRLHFTRKGYHLQGNLLFDAIIAAYEGYKRVHSR